MTLTLSGRLALRLLGGPEFQPADRGAADSIDVDPVKAIGAEREVFLVIEIAQAARDKGRQSETLPLRILPLRRFPPLAKLQGHREAQEDKSSADGKWSCPIRSLRGFSEGSLGRVQDWCAAE